MDITVVSASRQTQYLYEATVPISVITAEDIHYSGLTNIPEALQFTPGVDVIPLSRTRYAVGVRGLHDFIADRTLTLIDGRTADNPVFGGSEFYRYPILMEDIERIEVVRGPGGAAWGANAFTGVINIITKKPNQEPGWLFSTQVSEYGDTYNYLRWSRQKDRLSWRTSIGYETMADSDAAGAGKTVSSKPALDSLTGFSHFAARDYLRSFDINTDFLYDYSEDTDFSYGAAYSHYEQGDWEFLGYYPGGNAWYQTLRTYAKIDRTFDDDTTGHLQWYTNLNLADQPSLYKWLTLENDLEGQLNKTYENHHLTLGGNIRATYIDTDETAPESTLYAGTPLTEVTMGAFFIDRYELTDRWDLEGQFRTDWYSETQADWSTRLSALYALDTHRKHNLRFSFAKSFRTPFMIMRDNQTHRVVHPVLQIPLLNVDSVKDLDNEETWAFEAGYNRHLSENIFFQSNVYYQRYDRLIGFESNPSVPITYSAENIAGADSWGIETEFRLHTPSGNISLWHAYNDFQSDRSAQFIRSYLPAKHKAGLTGRFFLSEELALNINYRYTDITDVLGDTTIFPIENDHRLDLTLSKKFNDAKGEFMVGVMNVLNKTQAPNYMVGTLSAHETPGRTFFARLQMNF